jgi:glucose-1-phosphatase
MSPRSVDALLLDVGGVLVDISFERAVRHWSRCAGVQLERLAERFAFDADYEAHERGELSAPEYYAALRKTLGISLCDRDFEAGWCSILAGVIPGAVEVLAGLSARTPIYLFSNTNAVHYARWRSDYAELLAPVRAVFCSHELGARKPTLEAFKKVCSAIGSEPARIAFFDDTMENVQGAERAGMVAFHAKSPEAIRRATEYELHLGTGGRR